MQVNQSIITLIYNARNNRDGCTLFYVQTRTIAKMMILYRKRISAVRNSMLMTKSDYCRPLYEEIIPLFISRRRYISVCRVGNDISIAISQVSCSVQRGGGREGGCSQVRLGSLTTASGDRFGRQKTLAFTLEMVYNVYACAMRQLRVSPLSLSAPRDPPGAILCAVNLPRDVEVKLQNGLWDDSGYIGVGVGGFARTPRSRRTQVIQCYV